MAGEQTFRLIGQSSFYVAFGSALELTGNPCVYHCAHTHSVGRVGDPIYG